MATNKRLAVNAAKENSPTKDGDEVKVKPTQKYGYEQTLMSGHYVTEDLATIARQIQEERLKQQQILSHKSREEIEKAKIFEQSRCYQCFSGCCSITRTIVNKIGEDWVFLFVLGTIMAILSFSMDFCIAKLLEAHEVMYEETGRIHPVFAVFAWIAFPVILILFSTYFVHLVAPNAIGSGIPEMKTILRGVVLKEYLTFRTLASKMVGLTTSLGSGLPFGKEGPFVHIASIVATLLSKWVSSFRGIYENESRNNEMLAAAAATGVACTFAAPIGGVLFSIEVTATYFAVRNYWRGFFSAVCAAILFRLCAILFEGEDTVTALFKTTLRHEFPFDALELLAFGAIGIVSGFAGALFVWVHRKFIFLMRRNKRVSTFLQSYRFIYPLVVTFVITAATCPQSLGQYMGGGSTFKQALTDFFANVTWSDKYNEILTVDEQNIIARWDNPNIWASLTIYMLFVFLMSAVAITLPVPSGVFIPVFAIGAAFGRLIGEAMYCWFPDGINNGHKHFAVIPGGYAVVGAAAFSGAVTHTISTSMIVFELTGQMSHILPAVLAVIIANAIANILQPSIYDSIIQIKRLPYLPNFLPTNSNAHRICAEDIMLRDVKAISYDTTYEEVRSLLSENEALRSFPLVESSNNMILLGSVQRVELIRLLEYHLGRERRQKLSPSGESAAEVINEKSGRKGNGYKKKAKKRSPRATAASSDDETDSRRDRTKQLLSERIDTSNVYQTIGAVEERSRSPAKSILKKSSTNPDLLSEVKARSSPNSPTRDLSPSREPSPRIGKKTLPLSQLFKSRQRSSMDNLDKSDDEQSDRETASLLSSEDTADGRVRFAEMPWEQMRWEADQLGYKIDFTQCHVDPAPFQLVERTSLYKVHSLFSLLGLNHAYVTNVGKLVGVVSLKELQKIMVELLFHAPIIDPSDDSGTHSRRSSVSSHCTVDSSSHARLSDLDRPLDTIGEDNEGYDDFLVERGISRDMIDSRDARFSPAVLRKAISGPSIVGEERVKPQLQRQTTLTSTVGGVNLEYDKGANKNA